MSASENGHRNGIPVTRSDARRIADAVDDHAYTHHRLDREEVEASMNALGEDASEPDASAVLDHILRESGGAGADGLTVERYLVPVKHTARRVPDLHDRYSIIYLPEGMERDELVHDAPYDEEYLVESATLSYRRRVGARGRAAARAVTTMAASFF